MTERIDEATFQRLLQQSGWMRRLAGELCGDAAAAEDLVQDAWVAALERPPRDARSPRAWLARVLENLGHSRHRSEGARRAREQRSARPEALPSTADVVERAAIGRKLVECVLALEEPYRSTVLSRYFDELSAEAIAERDGLSSSTVRTRLARGLVLLRERLEREQGPAGLSMLAVLAGWSPASKAVAASSGAGTIGGTMATGTVLKVGFAVAVVAAVFWVARRPAVGPDPRSSELLGSSGAVAPTAVASEPGGPADASLPPVAERALVDAQSAAEQDLVANGVLIRVVEGPNHSPVSDAVVHWMDTSDPAEWTPGWEDRNLRESMLAERGREFRTDERGLVRVPRAIKVAQVCATKGDLCGEARIKQEDTIAIELVAQRAITAQVVGVDGKPVGGVRVVLRAVPELRTQGGSRVSAVTRAEDGLAVISHADWFLGRAQGMECAVLVDALLQTPLKQIVALQDFPRAPLRFLLPPTGSVQVRVLDGFGRLDSERRQIDLGLAVDPVWNELAAGNDNGVSRLRTSTQDGLASYPFVGLDLSLRARMELNPWDPSGALAKGPSMPGERVTLELGGPSQLPILVARILDESASPMKEKSLLVGLRLKAPRSSPQFGLSLHTDNEGKLAIPLSETFRTESERQLTFYSEEPPGPNTLTAEVQVDHDLELGVNDIGDVTLKLPPLIASGRIVDENHRPLAGAMVAAWEFDSPEGQGDSGGYATGILMNTTADGRFVLRGKESSKRLGVYVQDGRYLPQSPTPITMGARDVEIVLSRGGNFIGLLQLDPEVDANRLEVVASREGAPDVQADVVGSFTHEGRTEFQFVELPSGTYDFDFRLRGTGRLLLVKQARVSPEGHDPRLDEVDLRGKLHVFDVHVVDEHGDAIERGEVAVRAADTQGAWSKTPIVHGLARVHTPDANVELLASAPSHRDRLLRKVEVADPTIRLEVGLPVIVKLSDAGLLPPSGYQLGCELRPSGWDATEGVSHWREFAPVSSEGEARLAVGAPGEYEVRWRIARMGHPLERAQQVRAAEPASISVIDSPEVQRFSGAPEAAALAAALSDLAKPGR